MGKKLTTPDDEATAARAVEILEAPERARRAAEEAATAAAAVEAQRMVREMVAKRLAVSIPIGADVAAWFQGRPVVEAAQFEQVLGERHREAIDRAIMLGADLLERAGAPAQAECRRWLAALEAPLAPDRLRALIRDVERLQEAEPSLVAAHERWRMIRAQVAATLRAAVAIAQQQVAWLEGAEHA